MATTELTTVLNKAQMGATLDAELVQLEFDYEKAGVDGITQQQLEDLADGLQGTESNVRRELVHAFLKRGELCKKTFGLFGQAAEGNAWDWLRDRCGLGRRQVKEAMAVYEVFGLRKKEAVEKFAPTTLVYLSRFADHKRFITNGLALAEKCGREIPLAVVKQWVGDNGQPKDEISFEVNSPKTFDEAKAWIIKKVENARRKWSDELVSETAEILRAAADELNGKG